MAKLPTLTTSYWPASDEPPLIDMTCGELLRLGAEKYPHAIALIDADGEVGARPSWTYRELLRESEQLAGALASRFPEGTHIAVWGANSPQWVITQFALALAGLVMVTVNPALKADELAYVLNQSKARGVFYQQEYRGTDLGSMIEAACRSSGITLDLIHRLDQIETLRPSGPVVLPELSPHAPVVIQYTSGTTGQPKGALLSHHSVTNNARMMAVLKEMNEQTINLAVAPLFHTAGCVANVLGSLQSGGTLLLPSTFDAASMLDLIAEEKVTYTFGVPTMLIALLEEQAANPRDLSSLETVFSGAATVPVDVVKRVEKCFGARLIIGYGQTEISPAITHTRLDDSAQDKSETIG